MISDLERAEYLSWGGGRCPYCHSEDDIDYGEMVGNDTRMPVTCHHCRKEWYEVYELVLIDIEEIEEDEDV